MLLRRLLEVGTYPEQLCESNCPRPTFYDNKESVSAYWSNVYDRFSHDLTPAL